MNWLAHPASAELVGGVQGRTDESLLDRRVASVSAADCRLPASKLPIAPGWRNGKALLLRSSDSLGTSPTAKDVSPRRSRTVLRYSRAVRRRSGRRPAAFGSAGGGAPPVPVVA